MRTGLFGRALLLLLLLSCLSTSACARPSEADFTRRMAERIRAALPGRAVQITAEPLQLSVEATPETAIVNLGRLYNYCASATQQECTESIATFVSSTAEGLSNVDAPITRDQLRLLVRNTEYCESAGQGRSVDHRGPIVHPLVPGLCTILMADFPTRMRSVGEDDVRGLGLEPDAAWALAERQTLAELPKPDQLEGLHDTLIAVTGYDYVTSVMLNTEAWRTAAASQGELIVAVPASDTVIVARRVNLADLARFRTVVREHMETAERGVSPNIYHWTTEGWALLE
jgi:hypothetical protein